MYFARFGDGRDECVCAAIRWPLAAPLPTREWRDTWLGDGRIDVGLRYDTRPGKAQATLFVSAASTHEDALGEACQALGAGSGSATVRVAADAAEFDSFSGDLPGFQVRTDHAGYKHGGQPLGCDFRLYAHLGSTGEGGHVYQVQLRPYKPDQETRRRVLKYGAHLDIDQPFNEAVRNMQRALAQRLLNPGWTAAEFVALPSEAARTRWLERISRHFAETTGQVGFGAPPLASGDFTELLASGCHICRFEEAPDLPAQAAATFSRSDVDWLLTQAGKPAATPAAAAQKGMANVFLSYASADYAQAVSVCQFLENQGLVCWIAPRDIDRDILPYTEAIQRGIGQAGAVVVLISDTANLSVHIPRELDLALERKLLIIPMRLQDVLPAGQLNYLLRTCQWLNAHSRDLDSALSELIQRLRSVPALR